MSVIDELTSKLKGAKRAAASAKRGWEAAATVSAGLRKELDAAEARVRELDAAIAILRRDLKPSATPTDNITRLRT